MPKTHLDRVGQIPDSKFRVAANGIRQYLRQKVQVARDWVYQVGHAVAGAHVNALLKATSSVPTFVSQAGSPLPFIHNLTERWVEFVL